MAMRYIIQKREIEERHGVRPHLMGPYRTCYNDIRPPFDLTEEDKIKANLLRKYGQGRYQVKSIGKEEGAERSKITVYFTGDVEKYTPRAKQWTREERYAYRHGKWRTGKEKVFILVVAFILFLISAAIFFATFAPDLDPSLTVVAIILVMAVLLGAALFIDMIFFESE
jgi:hypothetical protein